MARILLLLFALAGLSCSGSASGKALFPVAGQVLLDEQPVPSALVVLHPLGTWEPGTNRPYGQTDTEGRFKVTTLRPDDGAPAGEYKVAILEVATEGEQGKGQQDEGRRDPKRLKKLPAKYANPETSGLRVQIREGSNQLDPFRLKPDKRAATKPAGAKD
jgi:hypothetical protein